MAATPRRLELLAGSLSCCSPYLRAWCLSEIRPRFFSRTEDDGEKGASDCSSITFPCRDRTGQSELVHSSSSTPP